MKILLIDDDAIVLHSLKTILESKGALVIALQDSTLARETFEKEKPDVLLMDIQMKPFNGLDAAKEILEKHKEAKILMLSTFEDPEYVSRAFQQGCMGYLLKDNFPGLFPAVEAVLAGNKVFDPSMLINAKKESPLSPRQEEILKLVAQGLSNEEIASALFLSQGTVRNYLSTLLEKLDLRDRTQLAIYYYKNKKDV